MFKTFPVLVFTKLINFLLNRFQISGGTALPGLIALQLDPNFIRNLAVKIPQGNIIISGTNGKTTTTRMLATILKSADFNLIHNRAGSNLLRGIASTLAETWSVFNRKRFDLGVWEVDEATVLPAVKALEPKIVVILNLFRDQLDRYGEIDKIKRIWVKAIKMLPKKSTLILNADDPAVAHLGHRFSGKVLYFGIEDKKNSEKVLPRFADTKYCPNCATALIYEAVYTSHLGEYWCPVCGHKRPVLNFEANEVSCLSPVKAEFELKIGNKKDKLKINLGGLYNIYNSLAAIAVAFTLGIGPNLSIAALSKFKSAFGRVEEIKTSKAVLRIFLIKNPTGANEVLKTVFSNSKKINILLALNDKIADGTDVSWIWDVDFEKMAGKILGLIITGTRAKDLALRLKYSGVGNHALVTENFEKAVKTVISSKENYYILPTYTAMLEIRKQLNKLGLGVKFWED